MQTEKVVLKEIHELEAVINDHSSTTTQKAIAIARQKALRWVMSPSVDTFQAEMELLFEAWNVLYGVEAIEIKVIKGHLRGYTTMLTF